MPKYTFEDESMTRVFKNSAISEWWGSEKFEFPMQIPDRIFHYTSAVGFHSILTEHCLRLTSLNFLNDIREIEFACDIFLALLNASKIKDKEIIKEMFYKKKPELFNNIFVLSFSLEDDSLPLWSYYGKNDGYNLEIDGQFIKDAIDFKTGKFTYKGVLKEELVVDIKKGEDYSFKGGPLKGHSVNYDKDKQNEIYRTILNEIEAIEDYNEYRYLSNLYLGLIVSMMPFFKHPKFINEKEYRILFQIQEIKSKSMDIIKYRIYNGIMIPYIELLLKNPCYFKSICLSPFNSSDEAKNSLSYFANYHIPKLQIRKSDMPIRQGW